MEDRETPCMYKSRETTNDLNCDGNSMLHCLQLRIYISGHFIFVSQDVHWTTIDYGRRNEI